MARKRSEQFKAISLTALLVIAWVLLPTAYKMGLRSAFYEFQAPVWSATSQVRDLQSYWGAMGQSKTELFEAGRDLARLNAAYRVFQQRNEALQKELNELEAILKLPSLPRHRVVVARVARRELSGWWQELVIRVGADRGIPVGAAVIFGDGVVGRIKEVGVDTSVVELISSRSFRMAATFEGDTRPVTYQGQINSALGPAYGHVRDVPSDLTVSPQRPQRLVSSRLGGVFPEGLTIGTVSDLSPDANGLFTEGGVLLSKRLLEIREVAVLVPIEKTLSSARQPEDGHVF